MLSACVAASDSLASPKVARIAKAKAELSNLLTAIQMYELDNGAYPSASQGLLALVEMSNVAPVPHNWPEGGYLPTLPKDPWGRYYLYRNPGKAGPVEVYSFGRDGKPGGCREDADIYSSGLDAKDSEKCKSQQRRENIVHGLRIAAALLAAGLLLLFFGRKLLQSVDGSWYKFINIVCIWLAALILFLWLSSFLFWPRFY